MAQKRQYGSGQLKETRNGWVIRWWEAEITPDGSRQKALRYERLGPMSRKQAAEMLSQKLAAAGSAKTVRSRVPLRTLVAEWEQSILPMYKPSTRKHRRWILKKHLLPEFGDRAVCEILRQDIQAFVSRLMRAGYAPKTIDHIHDVLSAVMRTAVKWGHLQENPARGVELPTLKCVRPKWALTPAQAAALLDALPDMARTMVGLAILSGLRRGEIFALRWRDIHEGERRLTVREAVYDGQFGTPKTEAGIRQIPLSAAAFELVLAWKPKARGSDANALLFATRDGGAIAPNNVLRRHVFPACKKSGLPRATWLTFRRTYSSWSHQQGVPAKVTAQLMGHANVDTTMNVYTQVLDGSVREAVERVGKELNAIERNAAGATVPTAKIA